MNSEDIVIVSNLQKSYGDLKAVKNISFSVKKGERFAFLGPNGAGKSTTISILCTLLKADSGDITISGIDINDKHIRDIIGIVFQESILDKELTVKENLEFAANLYCIPKNKIQERINWVEDAAELSDIINKRYGTLSGGQRRRTDIARALINRPELLFLDEPSTGLDPQSRKMIWKLINDLNSSENTTIFMTTHYMEEAADMDHVVVIDQGNIIAEGTPDQLRNKYTSDRIRIVAKDHDVLLSKLSSDNISFRNDGNSITIDIPDTLASLDIVSKYRSEITDFEVLMGTMDDAFINIIGKEEYQ